MNIAIAITMLTLPTAVSPLIIIWLDTWSPLVKSKYILH